MRLRYTRHASEQLRGIADYLAERSPAAAENVVSRIRETARLLAENPHLGRAGTLHGTREFPVRKLPYVIVHRIEQGVPTSMTILAVYHAAQLRPGQTPPQEDEID